MSHRLTYGTFWLVWSPTGQRPPTFKHTTEESATREAERLATAHPGQVFVVLMSKAARLADSSVKIDFNNDHEIPF